MLFYKSSVQEVWIHFHILHILYLAHMYFSGVFNFQKVGFIIVGIPASLESAALIGKHVQYICVNICVSDLLCKIRVEIFSIPHNFLFNIIPSLFQFFVLSLQ